MEIFHFSCIKKATKSFPGVVNYATKTNRVMGIGFWAWDKKIKGFN
jgi:hypothetical protein